MKSAAIWILCANCLTVLAQSVPDFAPKQDFIDNVQDQVIQSQAANTLSDVQQRNYENNGNFNLDGTPFTEPYTIEYKYHNYDKMTKFLRQTTARYPSLTALYSIGRSVQGKINIFIRYPSSGN